MTDPRLAVFRIASPADFGSPLRRAVAASLRAGRRNIVLVIHHQGGIHYEHIQSLASAQRAVRRCGGLLSLVIMRDDLRFIFRLLRLNEQFNVIERVEEIPHLRLPAAGEGKRPS